MTLSKIFLSPYYVLSVDGTIKELYPCADEESAKYLKENLQKLLPDAIVTIQKGGEWLCHS